MTIHKPGTPTHKAYVSPHPRYYNRNKRILLARENGRLYFALACIPGKLQATYKTPRPSASLVVTAVDVPPFGTPAFWQFVEQENLRLNQ